MSRIADITRTTNETDIHVKMNLDGNGIGIIDTGVGFFDHMLNLFSFHSGIDLEVTCSGDLYIDDHHSIEDVGIAMGSCFKEALGDKLGIRRYGTFYVPMDESLAFVSLDISGRSYLNFKGEFIRDRIGEFSTEMTEEFLRAFTFNAEITLHGNILYGLNDHHKVEALFKALGRAIRDAISVTGNRVGVQSSKGVI